MLFSNPTDAALRLRGFAAVRELPRHEGRRVARCPYRSNGEPVVWKAPPLNTELLRLTEDPVCSTSTTAADADLRGDRRHHQRPARHADAAVGRRRRRPEERPVDPGSRRVHPLDPAHARRRPRRKRRKDLEPRAAQPAANVNAAEKKLADDEKTLATSRAAAQKALALPDAIRRRAHDRVQGAHQGDHRRSVEDLGSKGAIACGTFLTDAETVAADEGARAGRRDWLRRRAERAGRAVAVRAQLRALPHRGVVDLRSHGAARRTGRRHLARVARRRRRPRRWDRVQPARRRRDPPLRHRRGRAASPASSTSSPPAA